MQREEEAASEEKQNHLHTLKSLWRYIWPDKQASVKIRVILALLCLIIAKALSSGLPILYKDMINELNSESSRSSLMIFLILAYGSVRFAQSAFGELRDFIFAKVAQASKRAIALETFEHLHKLSLNYHLSRQTGGLSRVIERGTSAIQFVLSFMLFNIVPTFIELFFVTILLSYYFNWTYAAVTFFTVFTYCLFTLICTEWRLKYRRSMNRSDEKANTKAIDSLLNFETVKYFNNETNEYRRFDKALRSYESAAIKSQNSLSLLNTGQNGIIALGTVLILYMAFSDVQKGEQDIGSFVMVNTYMMQLFLPLNFLGFVYRQMKQSFTDMDKMMAVRKNTPEVLDKEDAEELKVKEGTIEFKKVCFSYNKSRQILKDLSLKIKPGQTLAIVGETGSGKSTIVRLLFRFYEIDSGDIIIDGQSIKDVNQDSLRKNIGIVPQDTVLFNDTIAYNIQYGDLDANIDAVRTAGESAQIMNFIDSLEEGMETQVGERGLKLSGGEKQRIAIARTILKNPPILALDEATSALDTKTEKEIATALQDISKNRTTIIIAHRLSTVVHADNIIVLKKGEISEQGPHKTLLEQKGEYFAMWERQKEIANYEEKLKACNVEI
ncbi:MAG: ABC transporter ATP-binding protein/permease [Oligoflexales bacterium]